MLTARHNLQNAIHPPSELKRGTAKQQVVTMSQRARDMIFRAGFPEEELRSEPRKSKRLFVPAPSLCRLSASLFAKWLFAGGCWGPAPGTLPDSRPAARSDGRGPHCQLPRLCFTTGSLFSLCVGTFFQQRHYWTKAFTTGRAAGRLLSVLRLPCH